MHDPALSLAVTQAAKDPMHLALAMVVWTASLVPEGSPAHLALTQAAGQLLGPPPGP